MRALLKVALLLICLSPFSSLKAADDTVVYKTAGFTYHCYRSEEALFDASVIERLCASFQQKLAAHLDENPDSSWQDVEKIIMDGAYAAMASGDVHAVRLAVTASGGRFIASGG